MPKGYELKGLREKRGKLKAEIEKLGSVLHKEERGLTSEEQATFDKLKTDFVAVGEQIRAAEADLSALDSLLASANDTGSDPAAAPIPDSNQQTNSKTVPGKQDRNRRVEPATEMEAARLVRDIKMARAAWCRKQSQIPLTREHVEACKRTGINPNAKELVVRRMPEELRRQLQKRALTVTTSGGGYAIAQDYSYELERALVEYGYVRNVARVVQTDNGAPMPWPTIDDTSNTGELLAINTATATNADPSFSSVTFGAYKFSSKAILVPNELMQDSAFDVDQFIFAEVGTRIGRISGGYYTTGTGSSQPKGVVACASAGNTTASATAFTADELTILAHSVDVAYRNAGGSSIGYMMTDDVLAYCMRLKDADGRPLVRDSYMDPTTGPQVRINGWPVFINQKMTGLTSNLPVTATKHVLFGDFSKFIIRDAGPVRLKRLEERYAIEDQVAFVGFLRSDSNCVNTAAIKYMLQA